MKNLVSVRKFTRDDNCSVEFDPSGFSVKDLRTSQEILRCNSSGDLYPTLPPSTLTSAAHGFLVNSVFSLSLWHRRLGHPGGHVLPLLLARNFINYSRASNDPICNACQLGKQSRLPFSSSFSRSSYHFQIIFADIWTSHVLSFTGFKYFLLTLDDFSHFIWTFSLKSKADVYVVVVKFSSYVQTQFNTQIKKIQNDNGGEFNNFNLKSFFSSRGTISRFTCPYTSQQNRHAGRMIRTVTNMVCSLLFQAHLLPTYWAMALNVATHLINLLPTKTLHNLTPQEVLFRSPPSYSHLHVFGCLCYTNISSTSPHKLSPRSTPCVFLGYPSFQKGIQCLDLASGCLIISRHVIFDKAIFPFASQPAATQSSTPPAATTEPDHLLHLHSIIPFPTCTVPPCAQPPGPALMPSTALSAAAPPALLLPSTTSTNTYPMTTRGKSGITKPRHPLSLTVSPMTISPIPFTYRQALKTRTGARLCL